MQSFKKTYIFLFVFLAYSIIGMELPQELIKQKIDIITGYAQKNEEKIKKYTRNRCIIDCAAEINIIKYKFAIIQEQINVEHKTFFVGIQKKYDINYDFYMEAQNLAHGSPLYNEKNENVKKVPLENIKKVPLQEAMDIQIDDAM